MLCFLVSLPMLISVGLAVYFTSGSPILFRGARLGRDGQVFSMYKFRTMHAGSETAGPGVTGEGDHRVTRFGHLLRRWKLDELPQLLNVLRGEMSIVGPRPEDPRYLPFYPSNQLEVLSVRPGMTGQTQLTFLNEEHLLTSNDVEEEYLKYQLPKKLAMDLVYVRQANTALDIRLVISTFRQLLAQLPIVAKMGRDQPL